MTFFFKSKSPMPALNEAIVEDTGQATGQVGLPVEGWAGVNFA
jgi:hypothetical protein